MKDIKRLSGGHGLNLDRAEIFIAELGRDPALRQDVEIDLSACRHVDAGAGWRLGNALRRLGPSFHLTVIAPEPRDFSGWWFKNITRSGLGFAIARYADSVVSEGHDVTEAIRQYYSIARATGSAPERIRKYLWDGQNFCVVHSLDRGAINPDDTADFSDDVFKLLPNVGFDRWAYEKEDLQDLVDAMFQAVQNVYDHAARKPLPEGMRILSYISMRYYKEIETPSPRPANFRHTCRHLTPYLPLSKAVATLNSL